MENINAAITPMTIPLATTLSAGIGARFKQRNPIDVVKEVSSKGSKFNCKLLIIECLALFSNLL